MINYAGTISQLANNELQVDSQQRAALERMLARLIDQKNIKRQDAQQTRQLDQRDAAQQQQQRQFDTSMAADATREGRLASQFDANMGLQRDQMRQHQRDRRMDMLQRRRVFTMNEQDRAIRSLMPYAEQMANEGMFENMEDVIKQFPSLASQAPMLAGRSSAARRALEGEVMSDRADAALLNEGPAQIGRLQHMIAAEKEDSWNPDRNRWYGDTPDADAVSEWSREMEAIRSATEGVSRDRGRMGRLSPDASGRFAPNTVLPWRGTSTGTTQMRPVMGDVRQAEGASRGILPPEVAMQYLQRTNGDKNAARQLAVQDGWQLQ